MPHSHDIMYIIIIHRSGNVLHEISCPHNINYADKLFLSEESAGANTILVALTI